MKDGQEPELLLGRQTPVHEHYAPSVLYPIPRGESRGTLDMPAGSRFHGCDVWHAYEISWIDPYGRPTARVGRLSVPADSPCMVESKSLKLYLNSLNGESFDCEESFCQTVREDVGRVVQADIQLQLYAPDDPCVAGSALRGDCLDDLQPVPAPAPADASCLTCGADTVREEVLYTHLLRSLCPVTGQPDWASVRICYDGRRMHRPGLLGYLLSFRNHQEFHEQCVERIFCDILRACAPT
ncbi:MAG: NADPH-dependent 7-cyano-7-deazaguanine reductase QueF, partial [Halioglobus sp.]|nr:NADPH-dependent 7-cyano-7-deazaguanine reductase QueF [Halioglobus sp.]